MLTDRLLSAVRTRAPGRVLLAALLVAVLASCGTPGGGRQLDEVPSAASSSPAAEEPVESSPAAPVEESTSVTPTVAVPNRTPPAERDHVSESVSAPPAGHETFEMSNLSHTGPYLFRGGSGFAANGESTFRTAWGKDLELSMQVHVPGEDIRREEWAFGWDEEGTFLVGLAEIRTPAAGLEPEKTWYVLVRVDPLALTTTEIRLDLEIPGEDLVLVTAAPEAMVVLDYEREESWDRTVIGVSLVEGGGVQWTIDDERELQWHDLSWTSAEPPVAVTGLFHDNSINGCGKPSALVAVDLTSGKEVWRETISPGDRVCYLDGYARIADGRWVRLRESEDPGAGDGRGLGRTFVRSLATGVRQEFSSVLDSSTVLEIGGTLAWIAPPWRDDEEDPGWRVVDLATGESFFRLTREEVDELDVEVKALHDGILYLSTTDEDLALDARTGQEVGTWTEYPVDMIAGDVELSDGNLYRAPWEYSG